VKRRKVFRNGIRGIYEFTGEFVPSPHRPKLFKDLDISLAQISQNEKQYDDIESELAGLDEAAWSFLKQEARPYVLKRGQHRAWQQLFDILQSSESIRLSKREGCQELRSFHDLRLTVNKRLTSRRRPRKGRFV